MSVAAKERVCANPECGKVFIQSRPNSKKQRFCSRACGRRGRRKAAVVDLAERRVA